MIFEGVYKNGKKWNGKIYQYNWTTLDSEFKLENGKVSIKKYYSNGKLEYEYEYVNGTKDWNKQRILWKWTIKIWNIILKW